MHRQSLGADASVMCEHSVLERTRTGCGSVLEVVQENKAVAMHFIQGMMPGATATWMRPGATAICLKLYKG
eukprot:1161873-Pelagomonas_calceolata.AAC.3